MTVVMSREISYRDRNRFLSRAVNMFFIAVKLRRETEYRLDSDGYVFVFSFLNLIDGEIVVRLPEQF